MRRGPVLLTLLVYMLLGSGCNTMAGFGQDVAAAGHALTGSADKIQGSGSSGSGSNAQPTR
jgi:predicted small secreted protein